MLIVSYPCDETFLDRAPFPVEIETKLLEMDRLLEDPKLLLQVTNDLAESAPQALDNGRPATPAAVTLRMSVVRRLMGWSYETAYQEIQGRKRLESRRVGNCAWMAPSSKPTFITRPIAGCCLIVRGSWDAS
jgi:hypothetical protein